MKYLVCIEETVTKNFEVEASDKDEALEKAENAYWQGKYVLEPGELQGVGFDIVSDIRN